MSSLGWTHLATAITSMAAGAFVLLYTRKGTRLHRQAGWVYVASMLSLNATALMIYRLFGRFGPFHVFALISLFSISMAVFAAVSARRARVAKDKERRAKWLATHYHSMSWSYVGLMAAAVSETATRLPIAHAGRGPGLAFGIAVGIATFVVAGIGAWLIRGNASSSLQPFRATT